MSSGGNGGGFGGFLTRDGFPPFDVQRLLRVDQVVAQDRLHLVEVAAVDVGDALVERGVGRRPRRRGHLLLHVELGSGVDLSETGVGKRAQVPLSVHGVADQARVDLDPGGEAVEGDGIFSDGVDVVEAEAAELLVDGRGDVAGVSLHGWGTAEMGCIADLGWVDGGCISGCLRFVPIRQGGLVDNVHHMRSTEMAATGDAQTGVRQRGRIGRLGIENGRGSRTAREMTVFWAEGVVTAGWECGAIRRQRVADNR